MHRWQGSIEPGFCGVSGNAKDQLVTGL